VIQDQQLQMMVRTQMRRDSVISTRLIAGSKIICCVEELNLKCVQFFDLIVWMVLNSNDDTISGSNSD
jgi:hypothetical protein